MARTHFLSDLLSTLFERRYRAGTTRDRRSAVELARALLTGVGEVSGLQMARSLIERYEAMDDAEKVDYFEFMANELDIDLPAIEEAIRVYAGDRSRAHFDGLQRLCQPKRQELLRRINQIPGATAKLVAMRVDLQKIIREHPDLARLDVDFVHLFSSWFNRGFLVLRRIDWETPANILEKIIEYEAVHAIDDWDDLRRRIEPEDRHCFGFFHPVMPDEPLIFVEVALCRGIPQSVQEVLASEREVLPESEADTAVFYSISNCQQGLGGISFGNSLIKQVVENLSRDLPHLRTYVTLSPLPGFRDWLEAAAADIASPVVDDILAIAKTASPGDIDGLAAHSETLRHLAARYLVEEKRPSGQPLDPVARFHLGNGALIHDIHALADVSRNGIDQAFGVMVNYLYDPGRVEANHENFAGEGRIARTRMINGLLKAGIPEKNQRKTANA